MCFVVIPVLTNIKDFIRPTSSREAPRRPRPAQSRQASFCFLSDFFRASASTPCKRSQGNRGKNREDANFSQACLTASPYPAGASTIQNAPLKGTKTSRPPRISLAPVLGQCAVDEVAPLDSSRSPPNRAETFQLYSGQLTLTVKRTTASQNVRPLDGTKKVPIPPPPGLVSPLTSSTIDGLRKVQGIQQQ